jgi:transcriptional regulator with PAS, ATPase and Fis domain
LIEEALLARSDEQGDISMAFDWLKEWPAAVTVCDEKGIILDMNDRAAETLADSGGRRLVGTNVLDCHPEPARTRLKNLMDERRTNVYTIEKAGRKKLIYQAPWHEAGRFKGFAELSIEIPKDIPHFVRDKK